MKVNSEQTEWNGTERNRTKMTRALELENCAAKKQT